MSKKEKQFFCADANMCAILGKCNSQNKWELWGLSGISETGEAIYETRLFENHEFDDVEPNNATSGHTHIKVLKDNIWDEIVLIENKKATDKPIEPEWLSYLPWEGDFPRSPKSKSVPYLRLSFAYEDENESIESLVIRGAGENQTILIDQIEAVRLHESKKRDERLMAVIDYFLKNGIDVNAKDEWGESALMNAVYSPDVVNLLLQSGANVNDKDKYGTTAMFHACVELNIGVTNALLREGAEVDADCFLSIFNEWYLNAEEMQIQLELSKLLLNRNIDVNAKDSDGKTALMLIAESGVDRDSIDYKKHLKKQIELIEFILDRGADINLQNNEGKTALIYAVKSKNKFVAEYLLEQGADANIKDNAGNTALTYAQINSVRIIGKLRKKMNVKK